MPLRTIASFAFAILLGLIAVILVRNYIAGPHAPGAGGGPGGVATSPVVVAAGPIQRGTALAPNMLKVVNYPADAVPTDAYRDVNQLTGTHLVLRSLVANEPIIPNKISASGAKTNLSGTLTPGMRAVTLRSNDVSGVAGFALPGDRVDILLTRTVGAGGAQTTITQSLAENIRVLGVDQSDNDEADKPVVSRAITVEVTPDQAQAISLAQSVGSVSLSLRQIADTAPLMKHATTVADLGSFGGKPLAGAAPKRHGKRVVPNTVQVRVTRGVDVSGYPVVIY